LIERLNNEHLFDAIVPISAKTGDNLVTLKNEIRKRLPFSDYHFPEDQFSDRSVRFFVSEFIREQVVRIMGDELPYSVYVDVEQFSDRRDIVEISAIIWVAKTSQKPMLIGKRGVTLKKIGSLSRKSIEQLVGKKVFLSLWVKEKLGWQNDPRIIASFDSTR
jgi:GTP-binding protein Era